MLWDSRKDHSRLLLFCLYFVLISQIRKINPKKRSWKKKKKRLCYLRNCNVNSWFSLASWLKAFPLVEFSGMKVRRFFHVLKKSECTWNFKNHENGCRDTDHAFKKFGPKLLITFKNYNFSLCSNGYFPVGFKHIVMQSPLPFPALQQYRVRNVMEHTILRN